MLRRMNPIGAYLFTGIVLGIALADMTSALADEAEPTLEECHAAVEEARALSLTLPEGHMSRYFAERHLMQAMAEAGNNEFDECVEMARRATDEVRERRHESPTGEKLKVLAPHEYPTEADNSAQSAQRN